MSLVEQAARKLEQLRKAGAEVSGDVARVPAKAPETPPRESTVERAARRLESLGTRRGTIDLRHAASTNGTADVAATEALLRGTETQARGAQPGALPPTRADADDLPQWDQLDRREPSLGDALHAQLETPQLVATALSPVRVPDEAQRRAETDAAPLPAALALDLVRLSALGVLTPDKTDSVLANQLRLIKRPLIRAAQGKSGTCVANANRVMVTSALPGEGKSFIALNIAMSIAMERDSRVLLIDADTTRPSLSALFGAPLSQGLLDLLTNASLSPARTLLKTNIERLSFLPSGTPRQNATELLASEAMERLVEHLASRYTDRILIFDAPPLLAASEPPVLGSHMGQIVVVVEAQRTTHKAVQQALAAVASCPVVMTVLNKCAEAAHPHGYHARTAR